MEVFAEEPEVGSHHAPDDLVVGAFTASHEATEEGVDGGGLGEVCEVHEARAVRTVVGEGEGGLGDLVQEGLRHAT